MDKLLFGEWVWETIRRSVEWQFAWRLESMWIRCCCVLWDMIVSWLCLVLLLLWLILRLWLVLGHNWSCLVVLLWVISWSSWTGSLSVTSKFWVIVTRIVLAIIVIIVDTTTKWSWGNISWVVPSLVLRDWSWGVYGMCRCWWGNR